MHQHLAMTRERLEAGEGLVICGLGDSLTYGWMVERGFFLRFCDLLQARYPGAGLVPINAGVPGDTAHGGAQRLPAILRQHPDLLVVQFGLNDFFEGLSPAAFEAHLRRLLLAAQGEGCPILLATSSPLENAAHQVAVQAHYARIRDLGYQLDIPVAALDRYWEWQTKVKRPEAALWLPDGVHPTDFGHGLMAQGLLEAFERESV